MLLYIVSYEKLYKEILIFQVRYMVIYKEILIFHKTIFNILLKV